MLRFILLVLAVAIQSGLSYRSVCYYTNWSQYRPGKGKFTPDSVDANLCTHVIYAFATMSGADVKPFEWNDESTEWSTGMYEKAMALKSKNPSLKILIGVGGWNMGTAKFHAVAQSASARQQFAQNVVTFLRKHNFDGLDNDWEYPGSRGSPAEDMQNDVLFMQELRRAFDADTQSTGRSHLLLTTAIGVGKSTVDNAYDFPGLARSVDWFNVMTYDFHGTWETFTGHNSPLYADSSETGDQAHLNVDWSINYMLSKGLPKDKLVLGIPTYGRSFTLRDPSNHGLAAPASRGGAKGMYTRETGFLSYYEICDMIKSGATVYDLPEQRVQYLVKDSQWVGFDNVKSVREKACYAKQNGFAGVMYWALPLDDFSGSCGEGRFPLIKAANAAFQSSGNTCSKLPQGTIAPVTNGPVTAGPVFPTYRPPIQTPRPKPQTSRPIIPTPGPLNPCQSSNGVFPHATDCTKFFQCAFGHGYEQSCPPSLVFNPSLKACDYPYNVPSCANKRNSEYKREEDDAICSSKDGMFADPTDCNKYYHCSFGKAYSLNCPPTLVYDASNEGCDYPSNVPKCKDWKPAFTMDETDAVCADKKHGAFAQHSEDCHKYYQCSWGKGFLFTCPGKLAFNPSIESCDFVSNVPGCAMTKREYNLKRAEDDTICTSKDGMFADPTDCNKYYHCSFGKAYSLNCPPTLVYDASKEGCDFPANVPKCKDWKPAFTMDKPDSVCADKKHGAFAKHSEDCHKYYMCSYGKGFLFTCPGKLVFNPSIHSCDFADNVPGC